MKNSVKVFMFIPLFLTLGLSCDTGKADSATFIKFESLLSKEAIENVRAIIIIPLENACSSCSRSALQQLSLVDEKYKEKVQLVLTAKSFKLIDQVMEEVDLIGFQLHKDGKYSFWKHQLVLNSPSFYFIDGEAVVEDGIVSVQELPAFVKSLLQHLDN